MSFSYQIEVAVEPETSTTAKGKVLERLASRLLETQNFSVQEEVRLTAMEVDLIGKDKSTGETIFVECKAYRSVIAAEVLHKLYGQVMFNRYASGWLLSTFALSKDAKGFQAEWENRPPAERRHLKIYPPDLLVARLIEARIFKNPNELAIDRQKFHIGSDAILILTTSTEYWAIPVTDPQTGIRTGGLLYSAEKGSRILDSSVLDLISKTDTTLVFPWLTDANDSQKDASVRLHEELQSIVQVPVADHWADYRPARPEDFVGRERIQNEIFELLENVRTKNTNTRLIAIKGPSGWGKSSTVLKIAAKAKNIRNRGKFYVFTVDSRAATTGRFPELAVACGIRSAISDGFIDLAEPLMLDASSSTFSSPAMQQLTTALEAQGKVICIIFDQFEELLYKADLADVFSQMRAICSAVEEARTNLVIGFSWKTDGVVPPEHNAYHLWHALSDRRKELTLTPFADREVTTAINRFVKELGQPLIPQLRRVLQDHSQGFPWLLKKLCVHILELVSNGIEQSDILNQTVNIESLFNRDIELLSSKEHACLKSIASDSPAEFFKISQDFGEDIVSKLVDKRMVIRSGSRLAIYWDIFRDYVLTEKIPHIPVTYIPQFAYPKYGRALLFMMGKVQLSYSDLAQHMNARIETADNLVRDLANLGHVEANRREAWIRPHFKNEEQAISISLAYWNAHEFVRKIQQLSTSELTDQEFTNAYVEASKREQIGRETTETYARRVLGWLRGLGIVSKVGDRIHIKHINKVPLSLTEIPNRNLLTDIFMGEAPPKKVASAFTEICSSNVDRDYIELNYGANTYTALARLYLLDRDDPEIANCLPENAAELVAERALQTTAVQRAIQIGGSINGPIQGLEFGRNLADAFKAKWSEGTQRRYGNALRQWAEWTLANRGW